MKVPRWLLVLVLLGCVIYLLRPYSQSILLGIILAIIIYPVFNKFSIIKKQKIAVLICISYALAIITPIIIICTLAVDELTTISINSASFEPILHSVQNNIQNIPLIGKMLASKADLTHYKHFINNLTFDHVKNTLLSLFGINHFILNLFVSFIISILIIYHSLINAVWIKNWLLQNVLIKLKNPTCVLDTMIQGLRGSATSVLINASFVAVIMTILYLALSVPLPFLLGALTFIATLIPFLLTLFCIGLAGLVALMGDPIAGVTILIVGIALNICIDYFLQPKLLAKSVNMPFMISFLGIISGIASLGPLGILVGPALLFTAQEIIVHKIDQIPNDSN